MPSKPYPHPEERPKGASRRTQAPLCSPSSQFLPSLGAKPIAMTAGDGFRVRSTHPTGLQWVLAWAGLSAAWLLKDRVPPETRLGVAKLAAAELERSNI